MISWQTAKNAQASAQASTQLQSTIDSMQEHVKKLANENSKLEELLARVFVVHERILLQYIDADIVMLRNRVALLLIASTQVKV